MLTASRIIPSLLDSSGPYCGGGGVSRRGEGWEEEEEGEGGGEGTRRGSPKRESSFGSY